MADRLRIVTFSPGGRPIVQLDLADGATYALKRDSPQFNPPSRVQEWSQSSVRYGGARLAHEAHQNGSYTAEWMISGASTDAALANRDAFWAQLESIAPGRYLEVRPDAATRSSYAEIRGPAPWADAYRWIEASQGVSKLSVSAGFTTGPLWEGERMLIDDPFDVNSLTDYTLAHGSAVTYGAAALTTASTTEWDYVHTGRGYSYGDAQATCYYTTGTTVTGGSTRAILSWIDDNNYLFAEATGSTLKIWKRDGGANTQLATTAITAIAISTAYTIAIREEGNVVYAEHWLGAATLGTPTTTVNATLAGADAVKFGFGATGKAGFGGTWATPAAWKVTEFAVEPYTYVGKSLPYNVQLGGAIPGQAPARCDIAFSYSAPAANLWFGMAAWAARGTAPFGIFEGESMTLNNMTSTADALARGGNLAQVTTIGSHVAGVTFSFTPTFPNVSATSPTVRLEFWARILANTTITGLKGFLTYLTPSSATGTGASYPNEWAAAGHSLAIPSSNGYFLVRLGTVDFLPVSGAGTMQVVLTWTGGTGSLGIDYIAVTAADQRAASVTGKGQATLPVFWPITTSGTKTVHSQLDAVASVSAAYARGLTIADESQVGLGGSVIEIAPGTTDMVFLHSAMAPDDPAPGQLDTLSAPSRVSLHPVPRYFVPRGS